MDEQHQKGHPEGYRVNSTTRAVHSPRPEPPLAVFREEGPRTFPSRRDGKRTKTRQGRAGLTVPVMVQRDTRERAEQIRVRRSLHAIVHARRTRCLRYTSARNSLDLGRLALEMKRGRLLHPAEVDCVHAIGRGRYDLCRKKGRERKQNEIRTTRSVSFDVSQPRSDGSR